MTEFYSQLVGWSGTQYTWISDNMVLIISLVMTILTITIIFTLAFYYMNKYMDEKVENAEKGKKDVENRFNYLKDAYISLRYAYKNSLGIITRNISYDGETRNIEDRSREHLQNMNHHDLYINAERLSRESGVPDDA